MSDYIDDGNCTQCGEEAEYCCCTCDECGEEIGYCHCPCDGCGKNIHECACQGSAIPSIDSIDDISEEIQGHQDVIRKLWRSAALALVGAGTPRLTAVQWLIEEGCTENNAHELYIDVAEHLRKTKGITIAYIDNLRGRSLTESSILEIDGHRWVIPRRTREGRSLAACRIAEVLYQLGYQAVDRDVRGALGPDGTTIRIERIPEDSVKQ